MSEELKLNTEEVNNGDITDKYRYDTYVDGIVLNLNDSIN